MTNSQGEQNPEDPFVKAKYTAIISDLHLCEAQPIHPRYPLWKKYKTAQFFFDEDFVYFLNEIKQKSKGEPIELILNGDIFDFDSVTELPDNPIYRISWFERSRGLGPRPECAEFKIHRILDHHPIFLKALQDFLISGHRLVFVIGNHDVELHFPEVQNAIMSRLKGERSENLLVRFSDWFYISNQDTLVEHGNQQDPYCVCEDPINPFVKKYNHIEVKLPFGNLASRYLINGMGFFNPHVEQNYIMSVAEYVKFFYRYIMRAQPFLIWTWFWSSVMVLWHIFKDRFAVPYKRFFSIEDRVNDIARRANAQPRMVRELRELFAESASYNPFLIARELWLDRAFLILLSFFFFLILVLFIKQIFQISFLWMFIPLFLLLPFFMFYSKSVTSLAEQFKEPNEKILSMTALITKTNRVVYGHTHKPLHLVIGPVEHLNSGCWSPAFLDVECTKPIDQKNYIWIFFEDQAHFRRAELVKLKSQNKEDTEESSL